MSLSFFHVNFFHLSRKTKSKMEKKGTLFIATDLNPCLNVHCPRFGVCKTYSAHDARCECDDQCPSYQDPVCTANGTTYDNKCWHELSYCRGLENNLVYHPGSCEGNCNFCLGNLSGLEGPILLAWIFLSCSSRRKKGTLSRIRNSLLTKIVGHAGWTLVFCVFFFTSTLSRSMNAKIEFGQYPII